MGEASDDVVRTGGCLCGKIRYTATGKIRGIVHCHCSQCLRTHGATAAYTSVPRVALSVTESSLSWYASSDKSRRGFCSSCGCSCFYDWLSSPNIEISAGTFDQPTRLKCIGHIFAGSKSDYYEICDGLPACQKGDLNGGFATQVM